jgi:hypothetical protein
MRRLLRLAAVTSLVLATVVMGAGAAGAAETTSHLNTCSGTVTSPGVLAGKYYGNVVITGVCAVNGGAAVITGNLILAPGSALNATFALNDVAGTGTSSLTVFGSVLVGVGAVSAIGCEPVFSPCSDDPAAANGGNGTLTGQNHIFGNYVALNALTVITHATKINGNLVYSGGGGGVSCNVPSSGILAAIGSPPYLDSEDNTIGGNLSITGLKTCWLGALRNHVRRNVLNANNTMADPDADEILANLIGGSIACFNNSPAVQYGDSGSSPNQVRGAAFGECAFNVRQPNPAPSGPLEPISVKI